jgi:protein TonB
MKIKKNSAFILLLLCSVVLSSQENAVSFSIIEKAPIYPGCEGDAKELKSCFSKNIQKLFTENFNMALPNQLGLKGGKYRVYIAFKISSKGTVENIVAKAPDDLLEAECLKVLRKIPAMVPAELKGEKVGVKYAIPFTIMVEETRKQRKERKRKMRRNRN